MARPKIKDRGQIKSILTISIEEKYLANQDKDKLREVAYNAITKHVESEKHKTIN